jgi:GTP-binding protein
VLLLVNKVDGPRWDAHAAEFAALGWETLLPVSAGEGRLVAEALDELIARLPAAGSMPEPGEGVRIAILGRPNVGKSSLTNRLIGEERVIVDAAPGTTRDAIDVPWKWHKRIFWLIDTAGIRHRWDHLPGFEFYSSLRSIRALDRADVALLVLDATETLTRQDQRIAAIIEDSGKPVLILMNKWDAVAKDTHTLRHTEARVREALTFLDYAPMFFISALTGQRTAKIAERVLALHEASLRRVPTPEVNRVLHQAVEQTPPRGRRGRPAPKILYATQIRSVPPTFALFSRHPDAISGEYERYLGRRFREAFGFEGSPIRFKLRARTGATPARGRGRHR